MARKLFGIFYTNWALWLHYIPLVGLVFLAYWISTLIGIMTLLTSSSIFLKTLGWISAFLLYYIILSFGDQFIHSILDLAGVHD